MNKKEDVKIDIYFPKLEICSQEESTKVLKSAKINGDPYNGEYLTADVIKASGLGSKYKIQLRNTQIYFSRAYKTSEGRLAILGFVQVANGPLIARSYYRSNSQGVWRYFPDYTLKGGKIDWYSKGHSDQTIMIPVVMQKPLSEIIKKGEFAQSIKNPDLILAGTAFDNTGSNLGAQMPEGTLGARKLDGNFYFVQKNKISPTEIVFYDEGQAPDFRRMIETWTKTTDTYGEIKVTIFPSRNNEFLYMFCQDNLKRAWIGGVEVANDEITSSGLKKEWVYGGDLVTPAYEYAALDSGYGNDQLQKGPYIDMFENYLRKIPAIQDYLRVQGSD